MLQIFQQLKSLKKMDHYKLLLGFVYLCSVLKIEAKNVPKATKDTPSKPWTKSLSFPLPQEATGRQYESLFKEQQSWRALLEQIDLPQDHPLSEAILARIIDGEESPPGRWPWNVVMESEEFGFMCAGVLIARQWVLTAAHCMLHTAPVTVYAEIGLWNRSANDQKDSVAVTEFFVHPFFDRNARLNDISLLKLRRDVNVDSSYILSLPDLMFNQFESNPFCFITGWGVTEIGSSTTSDVLRERWVNVISRSECQARWNNDNYFPPDIYSSNICIDEGLHGTISSCQGDSGSPLQCFDIRDFTWKLAGIASWGSAACHTYPSVYTRIETFRTWIIATMDGNQ